MNNIEKTTDRKINHGADRLHNSFSVARHKTQDIVDQTLSKAEDAIEGIKDTGEEVWDAAMVRGRKGMAYVNKTVQQRPFRALGIAALVGLGAGLLLAFRARK